MALTLLGGVIFGILAEIAVGACFLDRLNDGRTLLNLEATQLIVEVAVALGQHRHLFARHCINPFNSKPRPGAGSSAALMRSGMAGNSIARRRNNRIGATELQARGPGAPQSTSPPPNWLPPSCRCGVYGVVTATTPQ